MNFRDIIAISGQPGLFRFVAQGAGGVIVESLADGRRTNATGQSKVSALAEIAVFTDSGEMPLSQVFAAFAERTGGKATIAAKSSAEQLKAAFAEIVPTFDRERVHMSDIKKIIGWYNILIAAGMTDFSDPEPEAEE